MVHDTARNYDTSLLNPIRPKRAMDPNRLVKFIDCPHPPNPNQTASTVVRKQSTKVASWNGEKCDVRPFEKFAVPENVVQTKDNRRETVDHHVASEQFRNHQSIVLLDETQHARSPKSEILHAPQQTRLESYAKPALIETLPVPTSVFLSEGLMHPKQRRERLEFETKYHLARQELKKLELQERRMHQLIHTQHLTNDVFASTMASQPRAWTSPYGSVKGYKPDLLRHHEFDGSHPVGCSKASANPVKVGTPTNLCSSPHPATATTTHDRLFGPKQGFLWKTDRAQFLRNEHEAGRSFNIINGGDIGFLPPTIPEKQHPRQAHPSIMVHPYSR